MALPRWTNHNVSDPGITLAELSRFLGEQLDFRNSERRRRVLVVVLAAVGLLWLLRRDNG